MKQYDVIVVGAGPAGSYVAQVISKKGFQVALLEEHREIGRPVQCAGLVTHRVFDILGYKCGILNEVRGAKIHSPTDKTIFFQAEKPKACVIDREIFDKTIAQKAVASGVELKLGAKVISLKRDGPKIKIEAKSNGKKDIMKCSLLIGADGASSIVARNFGFPKPRSTLSGFGAECISDEIQDKYYVDILVGNNIAPGFFAWIIPTDKGVRIGLCTSKGKQRPYHYFKKLISHSGVKERVGKIKIESYVTGTIPLGPLKRPYADSVMLVGDAAAHVKPLSGGGIYLGLLGGGHCADVAIEALKSNDVSMNALKGYGKLIQNDVGKELKRAYQLRKIYINLKDEHLEEGFEILSNEKLLSYIAKHGDIDYPSGLTKAVLKKAPRLMKFAGPVLKSLI
jgi:geranylgeranyl reductase family protein